MQSKEFCAYNQTRENFLSSRLTVIDAKSDPLKGIKALIEGLGPGQEAGLWLNPLKSVPTVPTMSPYDLVYLDQDCRVVESVAMVPDDEVPHFAGHAASALLLPIHTFSKSQAHPGDQVIISAAEEIEHRPARVPVVPVPVAAIVLPDPQVSVRKKESSRVRFLRGIARLRVHISFSIAPLPASRNSDSESPQSTMKSSAPSAVKSRATTAEQWTADSASFTTRFLSWSAKFARERIRALVAAIAASSAKASRACARNFESWKTSYFRWAEEFMHGPARLAARSTCAKEKRSAIQASRRQFLRARFH
jgi:hypothetical protein